MQEKGSISIHSENIFPIIKKFLYSDHEVFLRELVSNAVDATQKIKSLGTLGEYDGDLGDLSIEIKIDKKNKTLHVIDKGIGMTGEEIKKYINQIAFSGATEFVEKYKEKGEGSGIIGHFGLGFYSAFMVADKVEIKSLSREKDATPAHWICDGSTEFELKDGDKKERGSEVILHINEDSVEFLEEHRVNEILTKYCKFLPVPIIFGETEETIKEGEGDDAKEKKVNVPKVINNTTPLWTKAPADLTDEEYKDFYKELYPFSEEPLFWIHLNVDYPFNLTGILYFPKIKNDFDIQKNKIQLYSRQVFITDEVKDVVPEFLMLMHGVIDSPDIPLNVSRSYLQSDSNVKKINNHITKKVADKLAELYKNDRKSFEEKWDSVGLFVKYGMMSDDKFYDKAQKFCLLKSIEQYKHFTLDEYKESIAGNQTDKDGNVTILYATNPGKQDAYITSAQKKGYDVVLLDSPIDSHFINQLEQKLEKTNMKRVDADIVDKLIDKDEKAESVLSDDEKEKLKKVFEEAINNSSMTVAVEALSPDELPVSLTMPEFMRRMKDMQQTGGGMPFMGGMPDQYNLTINANHKMASKILKAESEEAQKNIAKQNYDLALLSQNMLNGKDLTNFISRSVEMMEK
ncbi:molecular chaperone HtpG [Marivirga salinae]|uniref:Chaperone protein HtpG n=1 Tax=Marivirga salinarum TaxID=3059078 RepID=A0AA51ND45_9BACT|nr:molecular chaperone HtpG [Marivirga sp. BDSF4-3]WMN13017.1 molecular chaperone HtpG [Marivirga sp. BDSF4-3]